MNKRSRSTLFLMEQLIVIAVFAVCAAACVYIMTSSYFMAKETRDTNYAISAAERGAEIYKATGGDIEKTAQMLGGTYIPYYLNGKAVAAVVYYDKNWKECPAYDAIVVYGLTLTEDSEAAGQGAGALRQGELKVEKFGEGVILEFPLAARAD